MFYRNKCTNQLVDISILEKIIADKIKPDMTAAVLAAKTK